MRKLGRCATFVLVSLTHVQSHQQLVNTRIDVDYTFTISIQDITTCKLVVIVVVKINKTQQHMISNTNGRRKGKKRQNDQRCDMLARVKLQDEGISSSICALSCVVRPSTSCRQQ